jgi:hypothetical protein
MPGVAQLTDDRATARGAFPNGMRKHFNTPKGLHSNRRGLVQVEPAIGVAVLLTLACKIECHW